MPITSAIQIIRSKRRTLALHILPDTTLVVKAPERISQYYIDKFISEHQDWIDQRIKHLQKQPISLDKHYQNGESFFYLGTPHVLSIGNYKAISVKDGKILFPQFLQFRIKKELTAWYIKQAKEIITERVEWYAKTMKLSYTSLTFADTKSRWGSCSRDNQLQFQWRLVMASLLVINYVVVHELVHTEEKNHSASFWSRVRYMNPSYRQQIKWLKEHGELLII